MDTCTQSRILDSALRLTKLAQEKGSDPLLWAVQICSDLGSSGVALPSPELAEILVSHICWENNVPIAWKFLDKALQLKIVPPILVLALLSTRVIPSRRSCPAAFRLYMELLKQHIFSLNCELNVPNHRKVMNLIDSALHLSQIFGQNASEPGILMVEFIFSVVWQLLDVSLSDEGLMELTLEKASQWVATAHDMEVDGYAGWNTKKIEHQEKMCSANTVMAIELVDQFLGHKVTSRILYLACQNMPVHWKSFVTRLQILVANSSILKSLKAGTLDSLLRLLLDSGKVLFQEIKPTSLQEFHAAMVPRCLVPCPGFVSAKSFSACWLPFDLVLEDAMDGYQVNATSAIEILMGVVKVLQGINNATWHETFLALWMAVLRLVQRERDPIEGPMPGLDTRLSILLSITTLVIADLIEGEEDSPNDDTEFNVSSYYFKDLRGKNHSDLVSSLQILGNYHSLLTPPRSVISAANKAAMKAMMFVSGNKVGSSYFESVSTKDMPISCSGNLRHLIVESCIARNLLDTSAYFWPGYVNGQISQLPQGVPQQVYSWSSFMEGAPLNQSMIKALASTPALSQG